jgi:hypothetical protein
MRSRNDERLQALIRHETTLTRIRGLCARNASLLESLPELRALLGCV